MACLSFPLALVRPTPLHLGVDNFPAVSNLQGIFHGASCSRPWGGAEANGDLWKKIGPTVKQTGEGTTNVSKAKGRATTGHVAGQHVKQCGKEGNDIADQFSRHAHGRFPQNITELLGVYTARSHEHIGLAAVVQLTIIRVAEATQTRRKATDIVARSNAAVYVKGAGRTLGCRNLLNTLSLWGQRGRPRLWHQEAAGISTKNGHIKVLPGGDRVHFAA